MIYFTIFFLTTSFCCSHLCEVPTSLVSFQTTFFFFLRRRKQNARIGPSQSKRQQLSKKLNLSCVASASRAISADAAARKKQAALASYTQSAKKCQIGYIIIRMGKGLHELTADLAVAYILAKQLTLEYTEHLFALYLHEGNQSEYTKGFLGIPPTALASSFAVPPRCTGAWAGWLFRCIGSCPTRNLPHRLPDTTGTWEAGLGPGLGLNGRANKRKDGMRCRSV